MTDSDQMAVQQSEMMSKSSEKLRMAARMSWIPPTRPMTSAAVSIGKGKKIQSKKKKKIINIKECTLYPYSCQVIFKKKGKSALAIRAHYRAIYKVFDLVRHFVLAIQGLLGRCTFVYICNANNVLAK